jgi:hypothetical protein
MAAPVKLNLLLSVANHVQTVGDFLLPVDINRHELELKVERLLLRDASLARYLKLITKLRLDSKFPPSSCNDWNEFESVAVSHGFYEVTDSELAELLVTPSLLLKLSTLIQFSTSNYWDSIKLLELIPRYANKS